MSVPETFFSVNEELRLFWLSCLYGAAFGLVFELFRTARLLFRHNALLVMIEDLAFCAIYCIFLSSFASAAARGELRLYFPIGNILGFTLYLATVGSLVSAAMKKLFFAVKKLLDLLFYPFRHCYVFLRRKAEPKFVGCSKVIVSYFKKMKILLQKSRCLMYNKKVNNKRRNVTNVGKKS
ncbi:MAG: hypothetical protein GXY08_11655 [Ruminococcus sp.]|nr:hypothetical protein [Ruminococcus sp.]